jgi:hypothetical protein
MHAREIQDNSCRSEGPIAEDANCSLASGRERIGLPYGHATFQDAKLGADRKWIAAISSARC